MVHGGSENISTTAHRGRYQDEIIQCETSSRYLDLNVVRVVTLRCPDLQTQQHHLAGREAQQSTVNYLENLLLSWYLQYLPGGLGWRWRGLHGLQSGPFLLDRLLSVLAIGVHFVSHGWVPDVVRSDGQLLLFLNGQEIINFSILAL